MILVTCSYVFRRVVNTTYCIGFLLIMLFLVILHIGYLFAGFKERTYWDTLGRVCLTDYSEICVDIISIWSDSED